LASYAINGMPSYGLVVGDGVIGLNERLGNKYPTLRDLLAAGGLREAERAAEGATPDAGLNNVKFLPVIPNPDKIIGVRANYKNLTLKKLTEFPPKPSLFIRLTNTLVAHNANLIRPKLTEQFDYEGELAVIIGCAGRYIPAENALDHVAGYTCHNDITVRDYQKHSIDAGKNFPASGPIGPWLVTTDEIPDPAKLHITTRLNGLVVQDCSTNMLHYSVPDIISYLSEFTELLPGDIIATGTPPGVGSSRAPALWMKAGDEIEIEIPQIGILRNSVVAET
jgi:2-keto-4-pentenoate hydratase/2-oxohepta-3-ene-1,7-dioic acid hydratase in catechol pathway